MGSNFLPTDYQSFIHKSRYAKYFDGKGRENWDETVNRYRQILNKIAAKILENIENDKYIELIPKLYKDLSKV